MYYLTQKDKAEMKYMGYMYRAWFKTQNGVPFHKDFRKKAEMELFIKQATEYKVQLVKYAKR